MPVGDDMTMEEVLGTGKPRKRPASAEAGEEPVEHSQSHSV
jgi:hypothetical protein